MKDVVTVEPFLVPAHRIPAAELKVLELVSQRLDPVAFRVHQLAPGRDSGAAL